MCSIFGWAGYVSAQEKQILLKHGEERGRDGFGVWTRDGEFRTKKLMAPLIYRLSDQSCTLAVGNFRAAPTTEQHITIENLQPYEGIVHNGTVANCDRWGEFAIDSMCLPQIFHKEDRTLTSVVKNCAQIEGGFALAYPHRNGIVVAANYKPVYYYYDDYKFIFGSTPAMVGARRAIKLPPYTAMEYQPGEEPRWLQLAKQPTNNKVLLAASSGLDSTTVAYMLKSGGFDVTLVYFSYNCNAEDQEWARVQQIAEHGDFKLLRLQLPNVMAGTIVSGEVSKDKIHGVRYADDWVSARNLLMLSTMTAYAESKGYSYLAYGGNLEESGGYPDNEEEFGRVFNLLLANSVNNGYSLELLQPLSRMMKHEIVKAGTKVAVPYELTWSCYRGDENHCGECAPCHMRKIAFERNGLKDPCQ